MVFLGLPVVCETIVQALRVPLGSVSVSGSWPAARAWASPPPGTPSGYRGHHRLPPLADTSRAALQRRDQEPGPTPLIGLRAGCNGLIALLLGLLAADALDRHFLLHHLHSQFGNLLLAIHTLDRLILGEPPMGQFGLEVLIPLERRDRNLVGVGDMLDVLSRHQRSPCCWRQPLATIASASSQERDSLRRIFDRRIATGIGRAHRWSRNRSNRRLTFSVRL
jgi:hypothetical protein